MSERATIGDLVDLVTDKAVIKPLEAKYVGLEQIEGGASGRLLGVLPGSASTSVNGVFFPGDILWGKLRPNLMKATQVGFDGFCSTDILVLRAKESVHPRFAAWSACNKRVFHYAVAKTEGTKMPRASWDVLRSAPARKPPPEEQHRIAAILDASDAAIRGAEAVIEKLQQEKLGLENQFAEKAIEGSGAEKLDVLLESGAPLCYGIVQPGAFSRDGVSLITISDMLGPLRELFLVNRTLDAEYSRSRVRGGDLLISVKATIGRVRVVPFDFCGNISRDIARVRLRQGLMPQFYAYFFSSQIGQRQLGHIQVGTTRAELSIVRLRQMTVPVPDAGFQRAVVESLDAVTQRIQSESAVLNKLRLQHEGLAHDLLTGVVLTHG